MDSLLEEDSCIYCSKSLYNLNEFNKRMHMNTCKVRKMIESSNPFVIQQQQQQQLIANAVVVNSANQVVVESTQQQQQDMEHDDMIVLGDSCPYCYRSFKDFKSDFNKRIHLKCCKIKKHTLDQRQQQKSAQSTTSPVKSDMSGGSSSSICLFCQKSLTTLNDFNKKMHIENCKIRKSIEGTLYRRPSKSARRQQQQMNQTNMELAQCLYCAKSFHNLSNFNKKLHMEHCKYKKKKSQSCERSVVQPNHQTPSATSNSPSMSNRQTHLILNHQLPDLSSLTTMNMSPMTANGLSSMILDLGDVCVFCSRSLANISNFNKRVHIEQCKLKQKKDQMDGGCKLKEYDTQGDKQPPRKKSKKDDKSSDCDAINPTLGMSQSDQQTASLNSMLASGNLINLNGVLAASLGVSPNSTAQMQHHHTHHHLNQYELTTTNHLDASSVIHHHVTLNGQSQATLITQNGQIQMPIDLKFEQNTLYG